VSNRPHIELIVLISETASAPPFLSSFSCGTICVTFRGELYDHRQGRNFLDPLRHHTCILWHLTHSPHPFRVRSFRADSQSSARSLGPVVLRSLDDLVPSLAFRFDIREMITALLGYFSYSPADSFKIYVERACPVISSILFKQSAARPLVQSSEPRRNIHDRSPESSKPTILSGWRGALMSVGGAVWKTLASRFVNVSRGSLIGPGALRLIGLNNIELITTGRST